MGSSSFSAPSPFGGMSIGLGNNQGTLDGTMSGNGSFGGNQPQPIMMLGGGGFGGYPTASGSAPSAFEGSAGASNPSAAMGGGGMYALAHALGQFPQQQMQQSMNQPMQPMQPRPNQLYQNNGQAAYDPNRPGGFAVAF